MAKLHEGHTTQKHFEFLQIVCEGLKVTNDLGRSFSVVFERSFQPFALLKESFWDVIADAIRQSATSYPSLGRRVEEEEEDKGTHDRGDRDWRMSQRSFAR